MCGIFGYISHREVSLDKVLKLLCILETHHYKKENDVGGHGAGVSFLDETGKMIVYKVGKTNDSPSKDLSKIREVTQAKSKIVLGHVRRASDEFEKTVEYGEATQPYRVECPNTSEIVSAHNGKVRNFEEIREGLSKEHCFQSEEAARLANSKIVDSEVIPHLFEENLKLRDDEIEARKDVFKQLEGSNTVVLLSSTKNKKLLHILHKGQTRGIHVWKNDKGEIILCSREEPLLQVFGDLIEEGDFEKVLSIKWKESREEQRTYELVDKIIPDLLNMKHEYFFRTIGNDGRYSMEMKCLFLVLILLIPSLIVNFFIPYITTDYLFATESLLTYFTKGWLHFIGTIFTGIFTWFLVRFLRDLDENFQHVNEILSQTEKEESEPEERGWSGRVRKYKGWAQRLTSHKYYYFRALSGAICGFLVGMIIVTPGHGWVQKDFFKMLYAKTWYVFYGYFAGASLHCIFASYSAIRKYCKLVVSDKNILPLDPDRTGGLRELGRISLGLDSLVAIPSISFPLYFLRFKFFEFLGIETARAHAQEIRIAIVFSLLYAALLIVIFFGAISPAHDNMVKAKKNYLLKVHKEYNDLHNELLQKLDSKQRIEKRDYDRLSGLFDLYEKVGSMAVWPLDFRTMTRFIVTSILPILSLGITLQIGV